MLDSCIALFSSFIACSVWEAIHIPDGLLENRSEIRPDTLHADTQGQSETVFGLAYFSDPAHALDSHTVFL